MLIVHGFYRWWRKLVAYRNDYCLNCAAERVAFQHRTFDVLHVFWLPIVPLGLWKRWHCAVCGQDPHGSTRTRKSLKWVGVVCLALFSLAPWGVSTREKRDDEVFVWAVRLLGPVATVWPAWATLKSPPDVVLKDRLRGVAPSMDATCPLCKVTLFPSEPAWRCPQCGLQRRTLPAV